MIICWTYQGTGTPRMYLLQFCNKFIQTLKWSPQGCSANTYWQEKICIVDSNTSTYLLRASLRKYVIGLPPAGLQWNCLKIMFYRIPQFLVRFYCPWTCHFFLVTKRLHNLFYNTIVKLFMHASEMAFLITSQRLTLKKIIIKI